MERPVLEADPAVCCNPTPMMMVVKKKIRRQDEDVHIHITGSIKVKQLKWNDHQNRMHKQVTP